MHRQTVFLAFWISGTSTPTLCRLCRDPCTHIHASSYRICNAGLPCCVQDLATGAYFLKHQSRKAAPAAQMQECLVLSQAS